MVCLEMVENKYGGFNNSAAQIRRLHFDLSSCGFILFFIQAIHELIKISEGDMRKVCKTRDNSLFRISFFLISNIIVVEAFIFLRST